MNKAPLLLLIVTTLLQAEPVNSPQNWLISALYDDQKHRTAISQLNRSESRNQDLMTQLQASQHELDQHNQQVLQLVIDELGHWPGIQDVGEGAAKISLILFKRSSLEQQAKYLPMVLQQVKQNNLPAQWYAELSDHYLMSGNSPQHYGHLMARSTSNGQQILYPIDDLQTVNNRRRTIGLDSLQSQMGQRNWLLRVNNQQTNNAKLSSPEPVMKMAQLALKCLDQIYPNSVKHVLNSAEDARPPDELYPAFFGCFDWHSSVHGHWLLARVARLFPNHPESAAIIQRLDNHFTSERMAAELRYFQQPGRQGFERPYGLAWFLQLYTEINNWQHPQAKQWLAAMQPLKDHVVHQLSDWIPKLAYPIRGGEHSQTAFAFGMAHDYASQTGDQALLSLINEHSLRLYAGDRRCPVNYEPSGHDFLSPCLAEGDLMRRVMTATEFKIWLKRFLPGIRKDKNWLPVAQVTDRIDGKLAHLDGLNLSRAWMLEGIAYALPDNDKRREKLLKIADQHASAGLAGVTGEHYAGGHWLGSFATYYLTQRGLPVHH
ncbi:DUF2891 domain-containing protein [Marinicella sediminis]|uniref:DUF2891 domain-containing protein n=1 Tax=Marinicella sediminis TaxID=1792834 RepID=A0ABV7J7D2_9GAMM|nr:DUF2891 domain-containing protein [Marinicella sediminis]